MSSVPFAARDARPKPTAAGAPGAPGPTSLEALVVAYRSAVARGGAPPELEVRLDKCSEAGFRRAVTALSAGRAGALVVLEPPAVTQMVTALVTHARSPGEMLRPATSLREIRYRNGVRVGDGPSGDKYLLKRDLIWPYSHAGAAGNGGYKITLCAEMPIGAFSSETAIFRLKGRISFVVRVEGGGDHRWRIDATVVRRVDTATDLPAARAAMFPCKPCGPSEFLQYFGLAEGANGGRAAANTYELEAEYLGTKGLPGGTETALRTADLTAVVAALRGAADPGWESAADYSAAVARIAGYVAGPAAAADYARGSATGLKRLLPQVAALTRGGYRELYPPTGLYLTDKADGRRAIAIVRDGRAVVVADELLAGKPDAAAQADGETILDGELVLHDGAPKFYAFDVIAFDDISLASLSFSERLARLPAAVARLAGAGFAAEAKPYVRLAGTTPAVLAEEFRSIAAADRPYEKDGLILVVSDGGYADTRSYKWKPLSQNTIDFVARRAPRGIRGMAPYVEREGHTLYLLFNGINAGQREALGLIRCPGWAELWPAAAGETYGPIQFSPSDVPLAYLWWVPNDVLAAHARDGVETQLALDGQVVELRCRLSGAAHGEHDGNACGDDCGSCAAAGGGASYVDWELLRVRSDRASDLEATRAAGTAQYFGNDYAKAAEPTWLNYVDPFPMSMLWDGGGSSYFAAPKAGAYAAQIAAVSFCKEERIRRLKAAARVVDLGAGRGQDLFRYQRAGVRYLIAVDRDSAALAELVRRKLDMSAKARSTNKKDAARRGFYGDPSTAMAVHVLAADLNRPAAETLARFAAFPGYGVDGVDAVVCNLAVHYFLGSGDAMRNFVALCAGLVTAPGNTVTLTCFDGARVAALLRDVPVGGSWDRHEDGALVFSLRRQYATPELLEAGQEIGVLLPFSGGQYYPEWLVNVDALSAAFAEAGFVRSGGRKSLADALPEFAAANPAMSKSLTDAAREYLSLYCELIYERRPEKKGGRRAGL